MTPTLNLHLRDSSTSNIPFSTTRTSPQITPTRAPQRTEFWRVILYYYKFYEFYIIIFYIILYYFIFYIYIYRLLHLKDLP